MLTSQTLTAASPPVLTTFFSPIHPTPQTPSFEAPLIATYLPTFTVLQTYTFVSKLPLTQCVPAALNSSAVILATWNDHRDVFTVYSPFETVYRMTFPVESPTARKSPLGE